MENSLINRLDSDTGFIQTHGVLIRNDFEFMIVPTFAGG